MRHAGLRRTATVGTLTAPVRQLACVCSLVALARRWQLVLSTALPANCAAIPLPVVAASTDREDGVTTGVTTPAQAKPIWASMISYCFGHFHHDTSLQMIGRMIAPSALMMSPLPSSTAKDSENYVF